MCADLADIVAHHQEWKTSDWAEEFPISHALFCHNELMTVDPKYAKQLLDTIEDAWSELRTTAKLQKLLIQANAARRPGDDEEPNPDPWTVHFADSSGVHVYTCVLTIDRRARLIHIPSCVPVVP